MTTTNSTPDPTSTSAPLARLAMITLDATETEPLARFWSEVLGWPIAHLTEEYAMLTGPSHALGIGTIPDHQRPSWPDRGAKQFHFDLAVEDLEAVAERCVQLGAERVEEQPGETWIVLRDPAGHPFCLTDAANWG
ncbi:VOC family protein [Brachybacterium aquaticum]|uniref:Putative enzyme related to lactoylglutathione lyase n=1 Tax=Brachybacterium aquaticum TaxID=1432564 RepID=A0A841A8M7_9MICO|nr:VOC family protein [Brachybacterium aquaticum]MBB5831186.1 putative enzyme related to lactoylglutathione lyase [Brachybacterium aquaticum]